MQRYSRREFIGVAAAGAGAVVAACSLDTGPRLFTYTHDDALIKARPFAPTLTPAVGYAPLGIATPRDGMMYVPTTYQASTPAPLVVLLHEDASSASFWQDNGFGAIVDDLGIVIVAPDSRYLHWDFLQPGVHGFGPDPNFINTALTYTFQRCNIDPTRIAIGGFADGACEALGVGIANGALFSHIMAFSPRLLYAPWLQGKPKIFAAHGNNDAQASAENTKTNIAQRLADAQYDVTYVGFTGGHELPGAVARQAFEWFLM